MSFVYGTGMLFAAFLLICVSRLLLNRPGTVRDPESFGTAEAIAYGFTLLLAFGISMITMATLSGPMPAVLIELAVSLSVLIAVCVATAMALGRLFSRHRAHAAEPGPARASGVRAGRPTPSPRPGPAAGAGRRRAA